MTTWKPYQLASLPTPNSKRRRVVEVISMPDPDGFIYVRMVPGCPGTVQAVNPTDLLPSPAYRYCQLAEVKCPLGLPEDMLRYDGAALYDHTVSESDAAPKQATVYRLSRAAKLPGWSVGRWQSFGAACRNVQTIDLKVGR